MQYKKKVDKIENSAIISMLLKPINLVLGLVYTPLLLAYLGEESYGIWATILSVISWINYFDVGIGNGLRNVLSELLAVEKGDDDAIRGIVSTAYLVLTTIASIILLVLIGLVFCVNWRNVFSTYIDLRITLFISFVFICVNFVLALSNSILYAMQKSELISLRSILVQLLNIIGILILRKLTTSRLEYVAILFGSTTSIVYIYNSIRIWKYDKRTKPSLHCFDKSYISSVSNVGLKFFVIQLMGLAMFTVDNVLITHYFGALQVTPFSIADKIFNTAYSIWAAYLIPYWSGTTNAIAKADYEWIKKSIFKTVKLLFLFLAGYFVLMICFTPIARLWLHRDLVYPGGLIVILFLFYSLYSVLAIECQFINGTGKINVQLISYIVLGLLNIPLSIILGVYFGLGVVGIRLATTLLVFVMDFILGINLISIMKQFK